MNKRNKKRGFTLIELIIVIAIIAILAAIAVPAFGQIRQKANTSADLANARTIYSLVATEIAEGGLDLPGQADEDSAEENVYYYTLEGTGIKIEPAPIVKSKQNASFVVSVTPTGSITVGYTGAEFEDKATELDDFTLVYPK
ncbi:prepilin-type N-terminal cleavage/methylation domain-containing protein [Turicibacter sanguinis]|uniref:prepilin-type N-terminal cleavage/methylation domain-containing protein n=1 Tax=Turicibacter sanguinis TaxID=154288 RepID=UPI0018AA3AB5|nr:prepilin-type N-terminal cleavage/methylation domain-containing protein [Turicibacter sanguinis]